MPNTLLAVNGSRRTLTWVVVIPSTGAIVGEGESGRGVSDEGTLTEGAGIVDVKAKIVGVGVISPCVLEPQPVPRRVKTKATSAALNRMNTMEF